jgi:uncharacterized protein (TIGR03083 family)
VDTWQEIDEERSALAEDLATLNDGQWETQSLCDQWKVRHVVGHLIFGADMKTGPIVRGLVRSGFNFNRFVAREALAIGAQPTPALLLQFRQTIGSRQLLRVPRSRSRSSTWSVTAWTSDVPPAWCESSLK